MKKLLLVAIGLLFIVNTITAQIHTISGRIINSSTNEAEPFVTLMLAEKNDSLKIVKAFAADENGCFKESLKFSGKYILSVSALGYKPHRQLIDIDRNLKNINLGDIAIQPQSTELSGVEIVAQKPLIKTDIDKITYDIEEDPDSQTNSILEMLKKVPMVSVDGEDKIKVKGSESFKIYINGKPNEMLSKNASIALKSMQASTIEKIEVITDPGAKYDAEGIGGILNIITKRKLLDDAYTASINGNIDNRSFNISPFIMFNKDKFTISLNYSYNHSFGIDYNSESIRRTTGNITDKSYDNDFYALISQKDRSHWANMEASYEIDSLNLISAAVGLWGMNSTTGQFSNTNAFHPSFPDNSLYSYSVNNNGKYSYFSINGNLDYQRLFSVKDRMLTVSYRFSTSPQSSSNEIVYDIDENYDKQWEDFIKGLKNNFYDNSQNSLENTFQIDYTTPFCKYHKLEMGAKYIIRDNDSDNDRYKSENNIDYIFDKDNSMHYRHNGNVLGVYAGYKLNCKKFMAKAGARYEYSHQSIKYKLGNGTDFNSDFNDVVPSVSTGFQINNSMNIKLGYNMRIMRPDIWSLNPYLYQNDPTNVRCGNTNLESEKNHAINLNYSYFNQKLYFNTSISYSVTNNGIQSITQIVPDTQIPGYTNPTGKDVIFTTNSNSGKTKFLNLSLYASWSPFKDTRITANLNGYYADLKGGNNMSNNGWNISGNLYLQQSFKHDWTLSGSFYGSTKNISLQTNSNGYTFYSLDLRKSFLKKNLSLGVYARDFFSKNKEFSNTIVGSDFYTHNVSLYPSRSIGFSITYKFGNLKASVKKATRTISNTDVKQSNQGKK